MGKLTGRNSGVTLSLTDIIHAVDVDDLTDGPLGTSKKWSIQQLADFITSAVDQFTELSDTPADYVGASLQSVRVNVGETGLEYYTPVFGSTDYLGLTDTPSAYTSDNNKFLRVNAGATGVEHVAASAIGLSTFNNDAGFITSNLTHTGEVTGAASLVIDKTAITNKATVTVASGDFLLISDTTDTGNLKKIDAADFLAGGADGNGIYTGTGDTLANNHTVTQEAFGLTLDQTIGGTINPVLDIQGAVDTKYGININTVSSSATTAAGAGLQVRSEFNASTTAGFGVDTRTTIGGGNTTSTALFAQAGNAASNSYAGEFEVLVGSTSTQNMGLRVKNLNTSGTFNFGLYAQSTATGTAITVPSGGGRVAIGTNFASTPLHVVGTSYFNGDVGIGTNSPTEKLDVVGSIKMVDGNQAAGKILTSDANGVASWQAAAGGADGNGIFDNANNGGTVPTSYIVNFTDAMRINGNLGLSVNAGTDKLSVNGNSNFQGGTFTVNGNGLFVHATNDQVGVGTITPMSTIAGASGLDVETGSATSSAAIRIAQRNGDNNEYAGLILEEVGGIQWHAKVMNGTNNFSIGPTLTTTDNSTFLIEQSTGNIGIGTATPTEKLEVVGNIKFSGDIIGSAISSQMVLGQPTVGGSDQLLINGTSGYHLRTEVSGGNKGIAVTRSSGAVGVGWNTDGVYKFIVVNDAGKTSIARFYNQAVGLVMDITESGAVGIGKSPTSKTILDIKNTTKALHLPTLSTTTRDGLSGVASDAGLLIYNTTQQKLNFFNGTAWETVTSV